MGRRQGGVLLEISRLGERLVGFDVFPLENCVKSDAAKA